MAAPLDTSGLPPLSRASRKEAALRGLARSMLTRILMAVGSVAFGFLLRALGWEGAGALALGLGACFLISGAWVAIQMDGVDDRLGDIL